MKLRVAFFLFVVSLSLALFSCRRNQPSLVDANRAPDTELWYAPPDSTESDYLIHLYWRGVDLDGRVDRYIWTVTDTLVDGAARWNPADRLIDFRRGRITARTDSIFAFTAFQNVGGVGVKKNIQSFHVASIDDNGVIDPSPAAIEFVATVEDLPEIQFSLQLTRFDRGTRTVLPWKAFNPGRLDTVGMFRPFKVSYRGLTSNGLIQAYRFFPLTADVFIPGQDEWTDDLSDTLRCFANGDTSQCFPLNLDPALPSGLFRIAAQVSDAAGAESVVDAGQFKKGVLQVVVNFEPDTEIFHVQNSYSDGNTTVVDSVNFRDAVPDTVPYNSYITLFYRGWDSRFDSTLCTDVDNKCIRYQVNYTRSALQNASPIDPGAGFGATIGWKPVKPEDTNEFGTADSTTMNLGSQTYTVRARSVDEFGKPDGTPSSVRVTGNFSPTLDSFEIVNYDGTVIGPGDTLMWDWWKPVNTDTIVIIPPIIERKKVFYFVVNASGHDHAKEPDSDVRSWFSTFIRPDNPNVRFGRSGSWIDANPVNAWTDTFWVTFRYDFLDGPGDVVFDNLPSYINKDYEFRISGRDTALNDEFEQFMFFSGDFQRINAFNTSTIGRLTPVGTQNFHFAIRR